jgi:hypothetical protein
MIIVRHIRIRPDRAGAASRPPDTGQPDTGQPGTSQPETGQPGTSQPETGQPGTRQRGKGRPGTGLRPGQVALLLGCAVLIGFLAIRMIVPLAEVRPAYGGYWPLMVAAGFAVAVGAPVLYGRAMPSAAWSRWPVVLLLGYGAAMVTGMAYFLGIHVNKAAASVPYTGAPPLRLLLQLAALAFTATCLTGLAILLLVIPLAEPALRRRARTRSRTTAGPRSPQPSKLPVRLRAVTVASPGKWLRGTLRLEPGSLLWEPAAGTSVLPAELANATMINAEPTPGKRRSARPAKFIELDTPTGRVQLEFAADLFVLTQQLATGKADGARPAAGPAIRRPAGEPADN